MTVSTSTYVESPAGPIEPGELQHLKSPPEIDLPRGLQVLRFGQRQAEFLLAARRSFGDVFRIRGIIPGRPTITSHPDHVKSLFTAKPELVPSLTGESPLRPIVGAGSVLTAQGARHLRQRKLLLPFFHGRAIDAYSSIIEEAIEQEIDRWRVGETISMAKAMQDVTLQVIMAGIFGIDGAPATGSAEARLARTTRWITGLSTTRAAKFAEYMALGNAEPVGGQRLALAQLDRPIYEVIRQRRAASDLAQRGDIMSVLLTAPTEDGVPLSDRELRDELITLLLAGHETTANSLAWAFERLTRNPLAYERLEASVREDAADIEEQIEWVVLETMRSRPVVPIVGRRVQVPWRLGEYGVAAGTPISISIVLLHHREDLYPEPWEFRPERWAGRKPGTYEWIPFGGGTRRCLGAPLAQLEMRLVLEHVVRRVRLAADRPESEHVQHRNVTMIPRRGARVKVLEKL
jgi:cytochrome P450